MRFDHDVMVPPAVPLLEGERSDRACAIRVRGTHSICNPLTRNGRNAPIPTSPLRGVVSFTGLPEYSRIFSYLLIWDIGAVGTDFI
jgi:hypothetical protein